MGGRFIIEKSPKISSCVISTPLISPSAFKVLSKCLLRKEFLNYQKVISNNFVITFCLDTLKALRKCYTNNLKKLTKCLQRDY